MTVDEMIAFLIALRDEGHGDKMVLPQGDGSNWFEEPFYNEETDTVALMIGPR